MNTTISEDVTRWNHLYRKSKTPTYVLVLGICPDAALFLLRYVEIRWDTRFQPFRPRDADGNTLLDQQMAYQNLVCFFSVFILMRILEVKILAIRGGRLSSFYLHSSSMASQRMNARFNKNFDPFVNLCHVYGHKPTSVLSVWTLVWWWWECSTEMYEKTLELEAYFQKAASSAIH